MMKNDYRRSLIMLRIHAPGYSGHVRLERRTLLGSLYAVINAPQDGRELCAALVRRDRGGYAAVRIGQLRRDTRGQAQLAYTFDPRSIDGRPLEEYRLIVIVARDRRGGCESVLSGNLNGSVEVDWAAVQQAACDACRDQRPPACDFCPPDAGVEIGPEGLPTPSLPSVEDVIISPEIGPEGLPTPSLPVESVIPREELPRETRIQMPAAQALGLDAGAPWPGIAEPLRPYFAEQPVKELMLGDGFVYVSAPMPEDSGYPEIAAGIRLESGAPVAVAYAFPGRYDANPPRGLEGYRWAGGAADGWWTIQMDVYTGAVIGQGNGCCRG